MYIVIIGCGRVGAQLATIMSEDGHNVVVIDSSGGAFRRLGSGFNGLTVTGNGFDEEILERAGIRDADICVAVTNLDNANIMAGQVAKILFNVPKVISRVYYPDREKTYHKLGLETVCGTTLVALKIRDLIVERAFTYEVTLDQNTMMAEIKTSKSLIGKTIYEIEVSGQFRPAIILRGGKSLLAEPNIKISAGDIIIAAISSGAASMLSKRYGIEITFKEISGYECPV